MPITTKIDGLNVLRESYDPESHSVKVKSLGSISPSQYDAISMFYGGAVLTGVNYEFNGETVRTVTLSYDGGNLTGVTITDI